MEEHEFRRTIDLLRGRIEALEREVFGESREGSASAEPTGFRSDAANDLESEVVSVLQSEGKIQAIKLYRERTGAGLKEGKDAVERLEQLYMPR